MMYMSGSDRMFSELFENFLVGASTITFISLLIFLFCFLFEKYGITKSAWKALWYLMYITLFVSLSIALGDAMSHCASW